MTYGPIDLVYLEVCEFVDDLLEKNLLLVIVPLTIHDYVINTTVI